MCILTDIGQQQFDLFSFIAKNYMVLGITWERIADTLEELVGMGDLAQEIRSKYNIVKPQTVTEGSYSSIICKIVNIMYDSCYIFTGALVS